MRLSGAKEKGRENGVRKKNKSIFHLSWLLLMADGVFNLLRDQI